MENFLSIQEVAKRLNVHPKTILNLIKKNKIRAVKIGVGVKRNRYRIYEREIDRFMAEEYETKFNQS